MSFTGYLRKCAPDMWRRLTPRELLLTCEVDPVPVVIACADAPAVHVERKNLYLIADDHWSLLSPALPALLYSLGVPQVAVHSCDACRHQPADPALSATWQMLYRGYVHPFDEPDIRRTAQPATLSDLPLPRRYALGIGGLGDLPFDITAGEVDRFQQVYTPQARKYFCSLPASGLLPTTGCTNDGVVTTWAAHLTISDCVACGVCIKACPHGALTMADEDGQQVICHNRQLCRSELRCVDLCPHQALHSSGPVRIDAGRLHHDISQPVELARIRAHPCPVCGFMTIDDEGDLCRHCRYRRDNPFGFRLPPGVTLEDLQD